PRGRAGHLDLLDLVTARPQRRRDGVDGLDAVELRLVLTVGQPQVVRESDAHDCLEAFEPLEPFTLTKFRPVRRALPRPSRPASSDRRRGAPHKRPRPPRTPPAPSR